MVNRHKMKRRWKRRMKKTSRFLSQDDAGAHKNRKDFAWKRRKSNPYRPKDTASGRKVRIQLFILVACTLATGGLLLYHPFFHVRHVEASGLERIDSESFVATVQSIIDYPVFFVFPKKNFFLFDAEELGEILLARFPMHAVHIETEFPGKVHIAVEEKISTLIYDNGEQYVYVGRDGHVIEPLRHVREDEWIIETKTVTSTDEFGKEIQREEVVRKEHHPAVTSLIAEFGEYPIVYDARNQKVDIQQAVLKEHTPDAVFAWFQFLDHRTDIAFRYMVLNSEIGTATIKTGEGWDLLVRLDGAVEQQVVELELALRNAINRNAIQYIDLRYPGRVYWR